MIWAIESDQSDIVKTLLENKADMNITDAVSIVQSVCWCVIYY